MRRTKGFTLIELLVVIAIIGLLVSILVPSIQKAKELAYRASCQANLNGIGKAMILYQSTYNDKWPLIADASGMDYDATMLAGGSDDVFALDGNASGEGTALNVNENLCLLVAKNMTPWKMFRCPTVDSDTIDRSESGNHDFGFRSSGSNPKVFMDYSYHLGYSNGNSAAFGSSLEGDFAILADQCGDKLDDFSKTGAVTPNKGDGYNHGDDGIAVLYAGGNVTWSDTVLIGWGKNNIYAKDLTSTNDTPSGGTSAGVPDNKHDSVLITPDP